MNVCDNCLSGGAERLTDNVALCNNCRTNQRGEDIQSILPLYEVVENTSTKGSLSQLAFHNLLNNAIRGIPFIDLESGGIGQGTLEFAISLYWTFKSSDAEKTDYPLLLEEVDGALQSTGDDSVPPIPSSLQKGSEAKRFSESMILMREVTGGMASQQQHRKVALARYGNYSNTLRHIYGFDIRDAVQCVDELAEILRSELHEVMKSNLGSSEWRQILEPTIEAQKPQSQAVRDSSALFIEDGVDGIDELWFNKSNILRELRNPNAEEFIQEMSCPVGSAEGFAINHQSDGVNTVFRCPYDVRPTEQYLFVEKNDQLLWPIPQRSHQTLAERFHFDLLNADSAPRYSEQQGDYVENLIYDSLSEVFTDSEGHVFHSVTYDDPTNENSSKDPETDIIVQWKDYLLIIECKSRSLLAATRAGRESSDIIENEVCHESGIGGAYSQCMRLISGIKQGEVTELRPKSRDSISVSSEMVLLPAVTMGSHYEYVATGGFIPFLDINDRPPYVADIYSLDVILQLTNPNELFSYIMRRIQFLDSDITFMNVDELDFFASFRAGILNPTFLQAVREHDFSKEVAEGMKRHPDADGATLELQIGDILKVIDRGDDFGIREQAKHWKIFLSVNLEGVPEAITLPINHSVRTRAYPLDNEWRHEMLP